MLCCFPRRMTVWLRWAHTHNASITVPDRWYWTRWAVIDIIVVVSHCMMRPMGHTSKGPYLKKATANGSMYSKLSLVILWDNKKRIFGHLYLVFISSSWNSRTYPWWGWEKSRLLFLRCPFQTDLRKCELMRCRGWNPPCSRKGPGCPRNQLHL